MNAVPCAPRVLSVLMLLLAAPTVWSAGDRFVATKQDFVLGQAPDWLDRTHVVWGEALGRDEDGDGQFNIYASGLDGREKRCLTCGLEGRHQVPVAQPKGDWILFHSWHGHTLRIGAPGFGGLGADVWVMTRDGQRRTNLTPSTEFHDNFHAYWSPDGRHLVWTELNWNADEGGNGKSTLRVGRFDPSGPRLVDVHEVRPGNGHWYETQWWAPDGSGFLYTETADPAVNPELYFCRLPDRNRGDCRPVRLTDHLAWDEQAIFTADMDRVLFMSSRDLPGAHNDWTRVASILDLPADYDYALILSVFSRSFLQPVFSQPTDLWELRLRWNKARTRFKPGALRRLTATGEQGWIIPEFAFDPTGKRLLWTQNKFAEARRVDAGCLRRKIRAAFVARMEQVRGVGSVPFDLDIELRERVAEFMRDPAQYPFAGRGCGGDRPDAPGPFEQETWIARFE